MLRAASFPALALAAVVVACSSSPLPGTQLGIYKVTGQSKTNTCGLGAPDPWTFDARLSKNGSTLYWSWMDGSAPLTGPVNAESHASIQDTEAGNVDGSDASLGPCTLQRSDDLELALGASSFTGTISYSFAPASGADCSDQLASGGGSFEALPCTVTYSVTAAQQ